MNHTLFIGKQNYTISRGFYVCITWTWTKFSNCKIHCKNIHIRIWKICHFYPILFTDISCYLCQINIECRKIALFYKNLYKIYHLFCICLFNLFIPTQTSDWTVHNSILLSDTIIMAGFPSKYSADELKEKLPEKTREGIQEVSLPVVPVHLCIPIEHLLYTSWTSLVYLLNTFCIPVEHLWFTCWTPFVYVYLLFTN